MIKDKTFTFRCGCLGACSFLSFTKWEEDGFESFTIEHYTSTFYAEQNPIWSNIKERLKLIWCAITGKKFYFYDLVVNKEDIESFKEFVNKPLE